MIEQIINDLAKNLDSADWLSRACVSLASELYTLNTDAAKAELAEKSEIVRLIDEAVSAGGKTSVAESEKRAVVTTANRYGIFKAQSESVVEVINSLKSRIRVLEGEKSFSGV